PDLATADYVSDRVTVLRNNPDNTVTTLATPATASTPRPLAVGAFDRVRATDSATAAPGSTREGAPQHGTLTLAADGSFSYRPHPDFVGSDSFTYRAVYETYQSDPETVTITVVAGCRGRPATIEGTSKADELTGTIGADVIAGLG